MNFFRSLRYAVAVCTEKLRSLSSERRNVSASASNVDGFRARLAMNRFLGGPALLCPWMLGAEDLFQLLRCDVCIDLRGRNIRMAEDGLYRAKVGPIAHHVGGATVT